MKLQLYVTDLLGEPERPHEAGRGALGRSFRQQPCQAQGSVKIEVVSICFVCLICDLDGMRSP
jgi:hypothetical protein